MKKILFALLMFALPMAAQQLPPGKWWRRPEVATQLGLAEEQQAKLDAIFRSAADNLIDSKGEVEKLNIALRSELDQPQLNRANLQRLATELSAARGRLFEREIMMFVDMRGVLSEQQWTKLRMQLDRMRDQRVPQQQRGGGLRPRQ